MSNKDYTKNAKETIQKKNSYIENRSKKIKSFTKLSDSIINNNYGVWNEPIYLSFSGCGFLCSYHIGALAGLREHGQNILSNVERIYGSSAGALIGATILAAFSNLKQTKLALVLGYIVDSKRFGILDPTLNIPVIIKKFLKDNLPDNIHELCTNKLFINLTSFPLCKPHLVYSYESKDEVIDALICTSFIPILFGFQPPKFRGKRYIDGGLTNNLPIHRVLYKRQSTVEEEISLRRNEKFHDVEHGVVKCGDRMQSITIAPFSGEGDICPRDPGTQSSARIVLWNMSLGVNFQNIYRFISGFIYPSIDGIVERLIDGYNDANRFLITQKHVKNTQYLISDKPIETQSTLVLSNAPQIKEISDDELAVSMFHQELNDLLGIDKDEVLQSYSVYLEEENTKGYNLYYPAFVVLSYILKFNINILKYITKKSIHLFTPILQKYIRIILPVMRRMPRSRRIVHVLIALERASQEINQP